MRKKRLQIISHSFPNLATPYDATFVRDHADALLNDFEVEITVPTPRSIPFTSRFKKNHSDLLLPKKVSGARCYYFSLPKRKFPSLVRRSLSNIVVKHLGNQPPDLIHIHFLYPSGLLIPDLKKHLDCPIILTIHGGDFYKTATNPRLRLLLEHSLKLADSIVAVGPNLKNDILEEFPDLKSKIFTIFNFVDTTYFKPDFIDRDISSNTSSEKIFKLLTVANLRYTKGIDTLIESIELLESEVNVELNIIGRLNNEPEFQKKIFSKIYSLRLKSIKFLGPKNRQEIRDWMYRSDGFILPSRREAFGISLIEAMACGLPVISTKSGGPEEILKGEWGYLVEPDDPLQLAEAIKKMIALDSFDAEGQHKYIEENYGKKRYAEEHKKLYDRLM